MNRSTVMKYAAPVAAIAVSIGLGFAGVTAAQTASTTQGGAGTGWMKAHMGQRPAVFGKVTAVSGTTLTVANTNLDDNSTVTYTVDALNAVVMKATQGQKPAQSTLGSIAVGDTVAIRGTVSGTNVTATAIMDGLPGIGMGPGMMGRGERGFDEHGVFGTVKSVSGNTVTLKGADGTTYTIDASKSDVVKASTISVGQITVGDTLGVRGQVSGTQVNAEHIMDGALPTFDQDR